MTALVKRADFLDDNYLSSERRVPVTLLDTNACSPLATNAIAGNIWDNFSSQSYKDLPSVGAVTVYSPVDGAPQQYQMPAGGRGYTRPPSLVSVWSSAPFLLNNALGEFDWRGSVEGRMAAFDDAIEQLLWPERRTRDEFVPSLPGYVQRTTARSYLRVAPGYLPDFLQTVLGWRSYLPFAKPNLEIGPIPAGTPVGLLANMALISEGRTLPERVAYQGRLVEVIGRLIRQLRALPANATDEQARAAFANEVPALMAISKCPDYVVNRGHYFGTSLAKEEPGLSDADKLALIAFLKTM
jgi:hypothetical protein